jgi:hypothetical protein
MMRRYWRARHNIFDYCGVYHKAPPLQNEDVQLIAETGARHAFRYLYTHDDPKRDPSPPRRQTGDFPYCSGGLLMSLRAAEALLPLISPWTSIQSDVLVSGQPSHILAIVTQVYDAMNANATIGRYHQSGIWLEVKELHLIDAKIGPSPIFRVPTTGVQWDHILSEGIVEAIRTHDLTGLTFHEAVVE